MKRLLKKKTILCLLAVVLLTGSTQVYATTILNTNILSLVKSGFDTIRAYFIQSTEDDVNTIEQDSSNDMKQYIEVSTKQIMNDLETYKKNEVSRADREMDAYAADMKKQLNTAFNDEKNKSKQLITEHINSNIEVMKDNLDKDTEKYIKDILKK